MATSSTLTGTSKSVSSVCCFLFGIGVSGADFFGDDFVVLLRVPAADTSVLLFTFTYEMGPVALFVSALVRGSLFDVR